MWGGALVVGLKKGKAVHVTKGGRGPKCFETGGMICGNRVKGSYGPYPQHAEECSQRCS